MRYFYTTVIFFVFAFQAIAQNQTTSLKVDDLINKGIEYQVTNPDSASILLSQAMELAKSDSYNEQYFTALWELARTKQKWNKFEEAKTLYFKAKDYAVKHKADSSQVDALLALGNVVRRLGNYDESMGYCMEVLKLCENNDYPSKKAKALNNIGITHLRQKNFDKAITYYNNALDIYVELNDSIAIADMYNNIGMIFDEKGDGEKAIEYYNLALPIYEKNNILDGVADIYNNIAGVYYQKEDLEKVLEYVLKSLEYREKIGDKRHIAFTLTNIGTLYNLYEDYAKGIDYIKRGLDMSLEVGSVPEIRHAYKNISETYAFIKDYKNAYEYGIKHKAFSDSIFNIEKAKNIAKLQTQYEVEKKEKEIALLKKNQEIARQQQIFFGIVAFMMFVIAIIIIRQNRFKSRTNKILKEQNEQLKVFNATKDKFFAIISHDLKNPISAFQNISQALNENLFDISKDEIHYFVKELNDSSIMMHNLLQNLLHWARTQTGAIQCSMEEVNINEVVDEIIGLCDSETKAKSISIEKQIQTQTTKTDKQMLTTVLRNLISNAVKFTPKNGNIIISSFSVNGSVTLGVVDSGCGICKTDIDKLFRIDVDTKKIGSHPNKGTGLGLILCKELVNKCNGQIWVESEINEGSRFYVNLPN